MSALLMPSYPSIKILDKKSKKTILVLKCQTICKNIDWGGFYKIIYPLRYRGIQFNNVDDIRIFVQTYRIYQHPFQVSYRYIGEWKCPR
jgi:hypothetical protein